MHGGPGRNAVLLVILGTLTRGRAVPGRLEGSDRALAGSMIAGIRPGDRPGLTRRNG
jgi:hypothetical protein